MLGVMVEHLRGQKIALCITFLPDAAGNAITSVHPSVHLFLLCLRNGLTINLALLQVRRS